MSLGRTPTHRDLFRSSAELCEKKLGATSIFKLLAEEGHRLFPDEAFSDLFEDVGRRSVPPRIVATVLVLQRVEGLSDREAMERFTYDVRWKFAAGKLVFDHPSFAHTVLVDMRERLRNSERPDRIFDAVLDVAKAAGLVGRKRVLDSTALYDAVATQDTVTMIRASIRGLLRVAPEPLAAEVRGVLKRDDDYKAPGKPMCAWDDAEAREGLVDALARDARAVLVLLDGRELGKVEREAVELIATVVGQDLEQREDGIFRIARRVAPDRVISTVDPEARHGHKTAARGFDGYKAHLAIDPDSEIITATKVTAGNVGDGSATEALLQDVLKKTESKAQAAVASTTVEHNTNVDTDAKSEAQADGAVASTTVEHNTNVDTDAKSEAQADGTVASTTVEPRAEVTIDAQVECRGEVYGDSSYGTADVVELLEGAHLEANVKVQPPSAREGHFSQDAFSIDTTARTVRCPNGVLIQLRTRKDGSLHADFGAHCETCPLRVKCTTSKEGRQVHVHAKHDTLARARKRQRDPVWQKRYRSTRPKVERKIAHLMRRKHGGRRARVRGQVRVGHDFAMLAAAVNLSRLAILRVLPRTQPLA
jgi:transposase